MKKLILPFLLFVLVISVNANSSKKKIDAAITATSGVLTVETTTAQTGFSRYGNKHILAIWIEDANGKFVKTLMAYANSRKQHLTRWKTACNYNKLNAIVGATQTSHTTRKCSWNGTNDSGKVVVPDGEYVLKMELTDINGTGNLTSVKFTKGENSYTPKVDDATSFKSNIINWAPIPTALEDNKLSSQFTVFPNPAKNTFFVQGADIQELELYSTNGTLILRSTQHNMNIESLTSGCYILKIITKNGTITKTVRKI